MLKYCIGLCLLAMSSFVLAQPQTWYFVRHFEKQTGDNPSLTKTGKARAEALATFFSDKSLTHVFSTNYNRTQQTATPVTTLKNMPIEDYDPRKLVEFAAKLKTLDHVLVVGHSNTTPQILSLMGGEEIKLEEGDFGVVYMLQKHNREYSTKSINITIE